MIRCIKKTAQVLDRKIEDVLTLGLCGLATGYIIEELNKNFPNLNARSVYQTVGNAIHEFIELEMRGETYVLDATWQQFLQTRDIGKPIALFLNKSNILEELEKVGVPERLRQIWINYRSTKYSV